MIVTIAKIHENIFAGEALSMTAPTTDGDLTILGHHEPLVATLKPGKLVVRTTTGEKVFEVSDGVLEVSNDQATVLL
jgi:F-type H+-transporting ATPase subunit epsilon